MLQEASISLTAIPLDYLIISAVGIGLLIIAILVYRELQKQEKKIEFTVFNSQYLGK